ncbi:hypothetical protein PhaeoP23_02203 [Phaeobacter piscinae]|uniref:Uncharacterized protein n=1 Tax=Phaeobacter piscinae TaxID=1580596 RepID=A0ABN5DHP8_9RHOB|nr:hypothetical protein [Phaeobacter piscinae]ATG36328.1 hypothetical protein PhaeoP36_02203 [Phaeobacter piscinae]AUQ86849.1 hypothetical protein PhaeoP42_02204 [Phaeobacter piscinae]AUR24732.1 hypothetical protein PhaeoP23_02203 [Phaeobacter piscinae]
MSEPVTQAEIEDVLSSIRRLVSEDSRAAGSSVGKGAEAALAAQIAKPVPAASGEQGVGAPGPANGATNGSSQPVTRLVLTPALRVPESKLTPVAPTPAAPTPAAPTPAAITETAPMDTAPPPDGEAASGKARFEALLAADAIEFWDEPEDRIAQGIALHDNDPGNEDLAFFNGITAATAADEAADETQDAALAADMPGTPTAQAEGALNTEAPWTDPAATLYQAAASTDHEEETQAEEPIPPAAPAKPAAQLNPKVGAVVQKLAEMEAANTARPVLWEPDGTRDTPYAGSDLETLAWDDQDSNADAQGQTEPVDQTQGVADVVIRSEGEDTQSEASQAEAPAADTAVEENTRTDIPAAPAASTADGVDRDLLETSVTETALEALDALGSDESFLDEHALRELVSEIVREELQGALGERITRNVRKLVRREIHRALSAQNLL